MKKSLTLGAATLALALSLNGASAFADEPVPINDTPDQPVSNCVDSSDMNCTEPTSDNQDGEIAEPNDQPPATDCVNIDGENGESTDCVTPIVDPDSETNQDNCAPGEECTDEIVEVEEETEPVEWPMYISLGALGAAVVVFIVLNLFGGKQK